MHVRHSLPPFMSIGLFQKNSKKGVGWYRYISDKNPWNLYICHFTLRKQAFFTPGNSTNLCCIPWKFQDKWKIPMTYSRSWNFSLILEFLLAFTNTPSNSSPEYPLFFFWNRAVIKMCLGRMIWKQIRGGWIRKYQVLLFFKLRQLKTTDSLINSDEVLQNIQNVS